MKRYVVLFDPQAQEEAMRAAEHIAISSPTNAARWFAGLEEIIESLGTMPSRCSRARENESLGVELRQSIYYSHRIEEEARIVRILHIRHAARRAISEIEE